MYADIIIDINNENVDKTFQYLIPDQMKDQITIGMCVQVPFGKGNTIRSGFVMNLSEKNHFPVERMKMITGVEKRLPLEDEFVQMAVWMQHYFGGTLSGALKVVLLATRKENPQHKKIVTYIGNDEQYEELKEKLIKKNATAKLRVLNGIRECKNMDASLLTAKLNVTMATVKSLEPYGILEINEERNYRNPYESNNKISKLIPDLNIEQKNAVDRIWKKHEIHQAFLLHGITGSGKTEVYMELIERLQAEGKQSIVLIPEIALTFQTVTRFIRRFGNRVSVIHSKLSKGEKSDQIERARKGEIDIMIGPRSALFTPFSNLGLIVIDEEHESSYKSEQEPKYHAREMAIYRGKQRNVPVILASATPSVESYYRAVNGEFELIELNSRFGDRQLANVEVVDLRQELKTGNRSIFSGLLTQQIEDRLNHHEQVMLFINRRGVMGFVSCRSCGTVMRCPHCDVSLTVHKGGIMRCHYCGYTTPQPKECPECGSKYIGGFRAGTQKIEELVKDQFPKARVLRMDADTTSNKGGYDEILSSFGNGEVDILVGTQMIVKGHDFPNVTLVGVIAADLSLFGGDYHGAEKTFQLLTQAAGRAGRGDKKGSVVIQTYQPDHFSILAAKHQDYKEFYEQEILYRKLLRYPPVSNLMVILISSAVVEKAQSTLELLLAFIKKEQKNSVKLSIVGSGDASVSKIQDVYRKIIYCRHESYDGLIDLKEAIRLNGVNLYDPKDVVIQFDFNPMKTY